MKRFLLSTAAALLLAVPAFAQYAPYPQPPAAPAPQADANAQRTVTAWYQRFLGRAPDAYAATWVQALQSGQDANQVLSGILGSDEYFNRTGGTPRQFLRALYQEAAGRPPMPREEMFWLRQMPYRDRADIAFAVLTRQPQNWDDPGPDNGGFVVRPPFPFR